MERKEGKVLYVGKKYLSNDNLNSHEYAQSNELYSLLGEATKIILRKSNINCSQILAEYLAQSNRGQNVLLKSFSSFSKSILCKICFLHNFIKIFEIQNNPRNGLDYYQLFRLLCSDFPKQIIQKSAQALLPNEDLANLMYKIVNSKKYIHSLYIHIAYSDFLEQMLGLFVEEHKPLTILDFYMWLKQYELNHLKIFQKPPFSVMAQIIINLLNKKGILNESSVVFLTEENIQQFIRDRLGNNSSQVSTTTYQTIISELIEFPLHCRLIQQNLNMFQNSPNWANQNHKILSLKEPLETPLNVKKKGSKK